MLAVLFKSLQWSSCSAMSTLYHMTVLHWDKYSDMCNMSNTLCSQHNANLLTSDAASSALCHSYHAFAVCNAVCSSSTRNSSNSMQHMQTRDTAAHASNSMQHTRAIACSTCSTAACTHQLAPQSSNSVQIPACSKFKQQHAAHVSNSMQHMQTAAFKHQHAAHAGQKHCTLLPALLALLRVRH